MSLPDRLQERNAHRTRRIVLIFLLILTVVVLARIASSAEGAVPARARRPPARPAVRLANPALRLEEPGTLVAGGTRLQRTVSLEGIGSLSSPLTLEWEARVDGGLAARGGQVLEPHGGTARAVVSIPLPALDRPAGLDLDVEVRDGREFETTASFPFLLYPKAAGESLGALFRRSRVALYDPEGAAAAPLAALGVEAARLATYDEVAAYRGDLIVVGPGGFSRGSEGLGPILAAQARAGSRLLLLDQPTLPGTLSEDLRLWPAFKGAGAVEPVRSPLHPVLDGLPRPADASLASGGAPIRPLLPPTRGNFRIISEMRASTGPSSQEGVTMLELPMGAGTILAVQSPLCAGFASHPEARLLLANSLAYLLGAGTGLKKTYLYGDSLDDLPACLARLSPSVPRVPADLAGVEILLVAGDWRAQRHAAAAHLPELAEVARYLREGGTVLLLNPQTLAIEYLQDILGAGIRFEPPGAAAPAAAASVPLLDGIAPEDLPLLARELQTEFRLRLPRDRADIDVLLLAPGIAEYRVGRGTLVALSLPDASDCAAPRSSSLLARFLTNLGVPLEREPAPAPETISSLDEPSPN